MIVVTTPSGNIGSQVVSGLLAAGAPIRVIVRDRSKLPSAVATKVDIVDGAHDDPAVVKKAFEGADALFWLPPSTTPAPSAEAAYVDFARPATDALKTTTIKHVVSISALGRGWPNEAGHVSATLRMDDMMAATGVNYTALACASLMENIARQRESIKTVGTFFYPSPVNLKLPHVATRDVAALSARLLLDRSWSGVREIPMLGPEDLSFGQIAEMMSQVLGKPISFHEITMIDMKQMMLAGAASEGMAQAMVDMLTAKNEGMDAMLTRTPDDIANTPTTFQEWCATVLKPAVEA